MAQKIKRYSLFHGEHEQAEAIGTRSQLERYIREQGDSEGWHIAGLRETPRFMTRNALHLCDNPPHLQTAIGAISH
jgi:hypothetical protein